MKKKQTITRLQAHVRRVQTEMKNVSKEKVENQLKDYNISGMAKWIKQRNLPCNQSKKCFNNF